MMPTTSPTQNQKFTQKRVAIIGAGWNGMQAARDLLLRSKGQVEVVLFDTLDDVGGTWHDSRRTKGMKLHSPLFVCEFEGMAYDEENSALHRRLEGAEVQEYNCRFADVHGLRDRTRFCRTVIALDYHSSTTQVSVTHVKSDAKDGARETQVFDFVLFASQCGALRLPKNLTGVDTFKGKHCHSAHFQDEFIDDIMQTTDARVAVVGASKSAVDVLTALETAVAAQTPHQGQEQPPSAPHVAWVYGRMYWFLNYERIFGSIKRTLAEKFNAVWFLVCVLLSRLVGGSWALWLLQRRGLADLPEPSSDSSEFRHYDASKCHLGVLDDAQFAACNRVTDRVRDASVVGFYPEGLLLKDGRRVPCTHAVLATGYSTGFDDIRLRIDGQAASPHQRAEHHFFLEHMPTIATGVLAQFSFGPMRASTYADLILKRIGPDGSGIPTLQARQAIIAKQSIKTGLGSAPGFVSYSKDGKEPQPKEVGSCPDDIFTTLLQLNSDWVAQGLITFLGFVAHWWGMFVLQVQKPMQMDLRSM